MNGSLARNHRVALDDHRRPDPDRRDADVSRGQRVELPGELLDALRRGGKEKALLHVGGADPRVLAMPMMPPGAPISIAADRKSFSMKGAENWVWTFTPTILQ